MVSEPWEVARAKVQESFPGVGLTTDNTAALMVNGHAADVVILAVKPQVMRGVVQALAPALRQHNPLLLTIAAGIRLQDLSRWAASSTTAEGQDYTPLCVRVMPNTPALLNQGASGLYAPPHVGAALRDMAYEVMASVSSITYWVDQEQLLDVVTGVSGSGPAYFFLMVEAMVAAGERLGLPPAVARGLAAQTCLGAGAMLMALGAAEPAQLRRNVTSPNGTTEAAIRSLEAAGFAAIVDRAVEAATKRGAELGVTLGQDETV